MGYGRTIMKFIHKPSKMGKNVVMVKKFISNAPFLPMFSPYMSFTCHRMSV
jgi:hypothetical protein